MIRYFNVKNYTKKNNLKMDVWYKLKLIFFLNKSGHPDYIKIYLTNMIVDLLRLLLI